MKILLMGISVRAMVESAARSNYGVIALDAFGDQDLRHLAETHSLVRDFLVPYSPEALFQAGRQLEFDAVAYTANLENHPGVLRRFASRHRIIGNPPQIVENVRNFANLFFRLRSAGLAVPESIFEDANRKLSGRRRWLVKPILSGGGQGIAMLRSDKIPGKQYMLQEYIPGKSCSASFVADGRECVILGVAEQLIGMRSLGSRDFRYCGNILPLPETLHPGTGKAILEQVRRLAEFLTREYALTGVNGIDFILRKDRLYPTEVNPRYSASMELMELAYALPIFHLHTQAVLDGRLPEFHAEAAPKSRNFFGKAILFADRDAVAPDTRCWHARGIRDIPAEGERLKKGAPICTILAERPAYEEVRAELVRQAAILKEEIYG
jgi:predicted ATP-grasp superfamily ATP-dependent carboligase